MIIYLQFQYTFKSTSESQNRQSQIFCLEGMKEISQTLAKRNTCNYRLSHCSFLLRLSSYAQELHLIDSMRPPVRGDCVALLEGGVELPLEELEGLKHDYKHYQRHNGPEG